MTQPTIKPVQASNLSSTATFSQQAHESFPEHPNGPRGRLRRRTTTIPLPPHGAHRRGAEWSHPIGVQPLAPQEMGLVASSRMNPTATSSLASSPGRPSRRACTSATPTSSPKPTFTSGAPAVTSLSSRRRVQQHRRRQAQGLHHCLASGRICRCRNDLAPRGHFPSQDQGRLQHQLLAQRRNSRPDGQHSRLRNHRAALGRLYVERCLVPS